MTVTGIGGTAGNSQAGPVLCTLVLQLNGLQSHVIVVSVLLCLAGLKSTVWAQVWWGTKCTG